MVHHQDMQPHEFHYFQNKEIDELYLSIALRTFAQSLIAIFVPIYLLNLGFSVPSIIIFYLVYYIVATAAMPHAMAFNSFGIKKNMAFGTVTSILFYLFLTQISSVHYSLVAIMGGLSAAAYFAGYHIEFSHFHTKGSEGKQSSIIQSSTILAASLGPILGGFLIEGFTYTMVFVIASVLLLLSLVPLFFTKDYRMKTQEINVTKILKSDDMTKGWAYIASGSTLVIAGIFWPLFIFEQLGSVSSLGAIISITSILLAVFSFYLGKKVDGSFRKVFRIGISLYSLSWILRLLLLNPIGLFISNTYAAFTGTLIELPMAKMIYSRSKNLMNYFLYREFYLFLGRVTILVIALFVQEYVFLFVLAFLCTQLYWFLAKSQKKKSS